MVRKWIRERKDILFRDLVDDYINVRLYFNEIEKQFENKGEIPFKKMNEWVGTETKKGLLWNLKDDCHLLLRDNSERTGIYEYLFDWIIGSIFHNCMKLKEDVYQQEAYKPEYGTISKEGDRDEEVKKILKEMKSIHENVQKLIPQEFEAIKRLFKRADRHLLYLLSSLADNGLLARYILENKGKIENALGKGAVQKILKSMYKNKPERVYYVAGLSYLEGGWFDKAIDTFSAGLKINPESEEMKKAIRTAEELKRQIWGEADEEPANIGSNGK